MNKATFRVLLALLPVIAAQTVSADDAAPAPAQSAQNSLPRLIVNGTRTADDNYRVESVDSLGPLGSTKILDTPYTIGILPLDLIENSQATNFKDVSKYLPLVAYQEQQGPEILRPQTRGMQGGNFQNTRIDGMTMFITLATAMEQFQQIEVVNGLSASLYGPANPSGMFNFVSKRPTDYDLREASVTYNSDSIGTAHVDLGGRFDKNGVLSYRLNALFGQGDGYAPDSRQRRVLGDFGLDVRPWTDTVLELNYSDYHLIDKGYPGWFTYGEKITLPAAPDPERLGYGQSYLGIDMQTRISTARVKHDFDSNWHLVVGALNQDGTRNISTPVNNLSSNNGNYTSTIGATFAPRFVITSDTAYLNGTFDTGPLAHDLTLGTAGYRAQSYALPTIPAAKLLLGTANINDPQIYPIPATGLPDPYSSYDSSTTYQQGVNLNDTVRFTEQWSARIGVSQDWFHVDNYSIKAPGAPETVSPEYSNHGVSPTGSIVFKPLANMTTYFTYASSLQAGDLAPNGTFNQGQSLAPYRSKEYELGYKAAVGKVDLTAAIFRIQRPFANTDTVTNIFEISGEQVNKGLELSAVGEVLPGLTVYGGVTLLNAKLENTPSPSTNDKIYVGAPKVKGNTLFEYSFPTIPGLVTSFNWQFSGTRPGNDTNSFSVAGYNLFDIGARYTSDLFAKSVTWRLGVDNVADRHYWSTIGPSNLTGTNTGNLLAHLGSPRTVLASASVKF